jgi:protein-tyrosine phosphatase
MTNQETTDPRRHLELEGARNVRDLGGYRTHDGGFTQWRRILRTDSLHALTPAAQVSLLGVGVRTVVDLRRTGEIEADPNVFADSPEMDYHHLNMLGDTDLDIEPMPEGTPTPQHMAHHYCGYLDKRQDAVSRILNTLAGAGNHAVLFHCAGGKDRTGVIAGLLLGLAGVPVETIAADYGLSAHYLAEPDGTWEEYQSAQCPPETMVLVLEHLERAYGGVEEYMQTVGVSADHISALRDRLIA